MTFRRFAPALAALACLVTGAAQAQEVPRKLERKVLSASRMLDRFLSARDSEIPRDLLDSAQCIVAMPDITKGAIGVGGRYGKGLASCRLPDGDWSAPVFLELGGASVGLQIGGERSDLLLVVRNADGAKWLLRDKFTLGADASVAAGPYGRTAGAATDVAMQAGILTYSRSRGAFVGVSVDGASLTQDNSDNRKLYGKDVDVERVLRPDEDQAAVPVPPAAQRFVDALERHAPAP